MSENLPVYQTERSSTAVQRHSRPPRATPGPWEVAYMDRNGQAVVKAEHIEICTCWHHCVASIEKEMHANARLIAAAPELLSAAKWALDFVAGLTTGCTMEEQGEIHQRLSAAIAKAEAA